MRIINEKLKFLYKKNRYLKKNFEEWSDMLLLSHILAKCDKPGTLISMQKWKRKCKINAYAFALTRKKCIIYLKKNLDWWIGYLPVKRAAQYINTITYSFVNNSCFYYLNENFEFTPHYRVDPRDNISRFKSPFPWQTWAKKEFLIYIYIPLFRTAFLT